MAAGTNRNASRILQHAPACEPHGCTRRTIGSSSHAMLARGVHMALAILCHGCCDRRHSRTWRTIGSSHTMVARGIRLALASIYDCTYTSMSPREKRTAVGTNPPLASWPPLRASSTSGPSPAPVGPVVVVLPPWLSSRESSSACGRQ